jgi:hypothetical protein
MWSSDSDSGFISIKNMLHLNCDFGFEYAATGELCMELSMEEPSSLRGVCAERDEVRKPPRAQKSPLMSFGKICVTLDVDWACDEIVEYSIRLLEEYGVKATIFATHELRLLKRLDREQFEVGIHPNLANTDNYEKTIDGLLRIYPDSVGVRCHGCFQSTDVFRLFIEKKLKYDSSTYIPLGEGLRPWIRLKKLVCIPFHWADDTMFYSGLPFNTSQLRLSTGGLKVYVFHPIHIFANTRSGEHYRKLKPFYHQPDKLVDLRGKNNGTRTLLVKFLRHLRENNIKSYTCREICQEWIDGQ